MHQYHIILFKKSQIGQILTIIGENLAKFDKIYQKSAKLISFIADLVGIHVSINF